MPYSVKHLIEGRALPVTLQRDDTMAKAWSLMVKYDFSQLPVVDAHNHPVGMVTSERILRAVNNFRAQLSELQARDVMVEISKADLFDLEEDLFTLLKQLKLTSAVLIVDKQNTVIGIVTSYDATEYFQNRAENLMRVEDIEVMVRDFVLSAYTLADGSRDEENLAQAVLKVAPQQKDFDKLSLYQYISMLTSEIKWSFFEPIFKKSRASVEGLLNDVRNTRNELAHFRKEITIAQTDQLRFCAEWLARCWEEYQDSKTAKVTTQPGNVGESQAQHPSVLDIKAEEKLSVQDTVQVIAEESRPMESKYVALADWLQSQPGGTDEVRLTFEEIEQLIGGSLPLSAYEHRAWWANDSIGHPHSQLWLEAGWRTNYLNRTEKVVTFVRIRELEKAYIEFFSKLLAELREKANFPIKQVSSDGSNWVVCQTINARGLIVGQFNYSFARGRRFRVELYIDTSARETTKQVFDNLFAQREIIEGPLGELSWERIDGKRASRIAYYYNAHITDEEDQLKSLRDWAVEKMIALYTVLEPIASKVFKEVLKP